MPKNKGKEWRRKAMAAGQKKRKEQPRKIDPTLSNKKRMELRRARRAYLKEIQLEGKHDQTLL